MKYYLLLVFIYSSSCLRNEQKDNVQYISRTTDQVTIFNSITSLFDARAGTINLMDSMAVLLLPIQAICPSCRKKIIDSIVSNQDKLDERKFIIISAKGGRKTMEAFFRERGHRWPSIEKQLVLDSVNQAFGKNLYSDKPVMFYCFQQRVYKKVSSLPSTVKEDLKEFFSK